MSFNIAMDGPVGAGKSTIADEVAKRLGILHLDTGAMYRAIGLGCIRSGVDVKDEAAAAAYAQHADIAVSCGGSGQKTMLDGEDVSSLIRTEEVSMAASTVARYAGVRHAMVMLQQKMAAEQDMLVDGRDICAVVLPDADLKIFLTASAEERATRRYRQLLKKGENADYNTVLADLKKRDWQDSHREVDPLRPTEDAIIVDTTNMGFSDTIEYIMKLVEEKRA